MELEICVDSLESLIRAKKAGADRIELCSSLNLGGLTPSPGLLLEASKLGEDIEIFAMARPRSGDFCYSDGEYKTILDDIRFIRNLKNIDGIVGGFLKADGSIDFGRTKEAIELAKPLKFVFHRAFDESNADDSDVEKMIDLGVCRILTSGKKEKALDGIDLISHLNRKYGEEIEIQPGSGVNAENIREIYEKSSVHCFHMSARSLVPSKMEKISYKAIGEFDSKIYQVDFEKVKSARRAIDLL